LITNRFKTEFAERVFRLKYAQGIDDTWDALSERLVDDVCGSRGGTTAALMSPSDRIDLVNVIKTMKFIPGGRYLYYSGRPLHFWNNCYCLRAEEDTREEWGSLLKRASDALMSGGGIGVDYSRLRPRGRPLVRTGGTASGPLPLMQSINEVGRNVMQGGSRRSAMYASLNWQHEDIQEFLRAKDWPQVVRDLKADDFNYPAPLDMTNISINWDTAFIEGVKSGITPQLWHDSIRRMCKTGEPGHAYNFYENENDTLRNACTEFTSEDDSDVCNLGSINLANIQSLDDLKGVVSLASKFLVCGTLRADLPYDKVRQVREQNRKIGLGIMGVHEWLLQRGYNYEVVPELKQWLEVYRDESKRSADEHCDRFYINRPKKYRAIAPTGTIGILAATTTGIEPMYAVAYKRRYLEGATKWKYQYVVEATAERLIKEYGIDPEGIETSISLTSTPEKRVKFQADIQDYVDMAVSSTLNVGSFGSKFNNEDTLGKYSSLLLKYAPRLRGITIYPDGARGGQPLTQVAYHDAIGHKGMVFDETEERCTGGLCGI
jgi:ribonucleoside-diphosphate reductase alpha chain